MIRGTEVAPKLAARRVDVIVVGAGFAGMYAVYKFREMGKTVLGVEAGGMSAVSGTGTATRVRAAT